MHGDHIYGLPGLLSSLGLAGESSGVNLYGPDALESYLNGVLRNSSSRIGYPLKIHQVRQAAENKTILLDDKDLFVTCIPIIHRIPTFAYRVDQKPKPGRFNLELAREEGIPPGPIYASLQRGETVQLEDGRILNGKKFCGPNRPGCSVVYCTDTMFSEAAIELAQGADLLIHEATYAHKDADLAISRQHSTSTMAAQIASEAGVGQLALTHLSPRYAPGNNLTPNDLLEEAKSIFPNSILAKDFLKINIQKQ